MQLKGLQVFTVCFAILVVIRSDTTIYKTGWLDRVVEYFKQRFIADVKEKLPPIEFKAEIIKAPEGYVDSKKWDYDSVLRLLELIRSNEKTRPLAKVLRRTLNPTLSNTRRFVSKQNSYKKFPKLNPDIDVYYENTDYDDYAVDDEDFNARPGAGDDTLEDDAVVVISNPVEARLPSGHISVKMLREILEVRAEAARVMPPTTKVTIPWSTISSSSTKDGDQTTTEADGNTNATETDTGPTTNNGTEADGTTTPGTDTETTTPGADEETTTTTEAPAE